MSGEDVGSRIRDLREEAGISLDALYARVAALLPESMWGSTEMLRRIERGQVEHPNPFYVAAIAVALGVRLEVISEELAHEARRLADLAGDN